MFFSLFLALTQVSSAYACILFCSSGVGMACSPSLLLCLLQGWWSTASANPSWPSYKTHRSDLAHQATLTKEAIPRLRKR